MKLKDVEKMYNKVTTSRNVAVHSALCPEFLLGSFNSNTRKQIFVSFTRIATKWWSVAENS